MKNKIIFIFRYNHKKAVLVQFDKKLCFEVHQFCLATASSKFKSAVNATKPSCLA